MGIDGIGKGSGVPPGTSGAGGVGAPNPVTETRDVREVEKTERKFEVHAEKSAAAQSTEKTAAVTRSPLERLRAGEIDVNGYVDLKVEAATQHLKGLGRVELDQMRALLKHQMTNDPAIVDLVKQATGALPKPDSE